MPSVEKLLLEIKADIKDLKNLRAELKTIKKESAEAGDSIGKTFSRIAGAAAGIASLSKISGYIETATASYNKLESQMLKVESAARITNQSIQQTKDFVTTLGADGVLSLDNITNSLSQLYKLGVQGKDAFNFLEASKRIGALNNIVGDTGLSVENFVKGILTGSQDLLENLDPALRKVITRLGGFQAITTSTTARQKLINEVIKRGTELTSDYNKFLENGTAINQKYEAAQRGLLNTIGKALAPTFNAIKKSASEAYEGIANFISGLSDSSKSLLAFGAIAVTSAVAIGALVAALSLIAAPILIAVGAIAALIASVVTINELFTKTKSQKLSEEILKTSEAAKQSIDDFNRLGKSIKNVTEGSEKYRQIKDALIQQAKEYKVVVDQEVKSTQQLADLFKKIKLARLEQSQFRGQAVDARLFEVNTELKSFAERRRTTRGLSERDREVERELANERERLKKEREQILKNNITLLKGETAKTSTNAGGGDGAPGKAPDPFGFIDAREQLKELKKEYNEFRKIAVKKNASKEELNFIDTDYNNRVAAIIANQRATIAKFIEDDLAASLENIELEKEAAIRAAAENYKIKLAQGKDTLEAQKEFEEEIKNIRIADERKIAKARIEEQVKVIKGASSVLANLDSVNSAKGFGAKTAAAGGLVSAFAEASPALQSLGPVGQGISAVGTGIIALTNIFDRSEENARIERERIERIEREKILILESIENYNRQLVELNLAQSKQPFEELSRNLRLNDIEAQKRILQGVSKEVVDADRLAKRNQLISETLSAQGGKISEKSLYKNVVGDADSLTNFLNQAYKDQAFQSLIENTVASVQALNVRDNRGILSAQAQSTINKLIADTITRLGVSGVSADFRSGGNVAELSVSEDARNRLNAADDFASQVSRKLLNLQYGGASGVFELLNELKLDIGYGENILSTLQDQINTQIEIKNFSKATAENTASLKLGDIRKVSGIDTFSKAIFDRGRAIFSQPSYADLKLPSSVENAQYVTSIQQNFNAKQIERLGTLIALSEKQVQLQGIMAKALEKMANSNGASLVSLIDQLSNISSLQIK